MDARRVASSRQRGPAPLTAESEVAGGLEGQCFPRHDQAQTRNSLDRYPRAFGLRLDAMIATIRGTGTVTPPSGPVPIRLQWPVRIGLGSLAC